MCRIDSEIECKECGGRMYLDDWTDKPHEKWKCMDCEKEIKISPIEV